MSSANQEVGMSTAQAVKDKISEETKHTKQTTTGVKSFLSGGFGGIMCVLVGHPFDLVKVRLQTAPDGVYKGTLDCVKQTLVKDGVRGLYRGMSSPLVGVTPIFAVSFWAYDLGKKIVYSATPNRESQQLTMGEIMFAGGFSAVPTTLLMGPFERIKVILQVQGQSGESKYKGPLDVIKALYKEGGVRSIFRGTGATLLRDGPGSAAYFGAYELTKKLLTPAGKSVNDLNPLATMVAGGMAGVAMWTLACPADVIKSRLQSAPAGTYNGTFDVLKKLLKNEGPRALFKGLGPAILRAFPANAATFVGVEMSLKAMDKLW
ncbi:uncharacterized protein VTP21DRAFT_9313 [Calcarisporiella thermophila]|uniref:uncharacterized protein n=1 Tax=Calcarisporiella thermophila TaxID=911321 RepID=UPI0037437DAD